LKYLMFNPPVCRFSRVTENLRDRTPFAPLNAVVEIFKEPVQPLPESAAHAAFPGAHEANEKNYVRRWCPRNRSFAPGSNMLTRAHCLARTLLLHWGHVTVLRLSEFYLLFCGAFAEVDFTTVSAQHDRR
jgi:hypothetical protein